MEFDPDRIVMEYTPPRSPVAVCEPVDLGTLYAIEEWCTSYGVHGDTDHLLRFNIGVYQLAQREKSRDGTLSSFAEASAAFCIHVMAAAGMVGAMLVESPFKYAARLDDEGMVFPEFNEFMLKRVTLATQQHVYIRTTKPGTARYGRIDRSLLADLTYGMVWRVLSDVPVSMRQVGFRREMNRLLNQEWKK